MDNIMNNMRVISKRCIKYNHHTNETNDYNIQYLQKRISIKFLGIKLFSIWKTIDSEIVPSYAIIEKSAFGHPDWKSK